MRTPAALSAIAAAVLATLMPGSVAEAATPLAATPLAATPAAVASWRVTLAGTVSGNPFRVQGTVTLHRTVTQVTTNGVNPVDVCLKVGFPAGLPQAGAIWYGSNQACFPTNGANIDMAYVTARNDQITVTPDSRLQAVMVNNWTSSASIAACPFSPTGGSAVYQLNRDGSLSGSVRLQGYGGAFCGTSSYDATLTGVRTS